MIDFAKRTWRLFSYNWKIALLFELIIHTVLGVIALPLYNGAFNITMRLAGMDYLTGDNIARFALCPASWLFFILLIAVFAAYAIFEICALINLAQAGRDEVEMPLIDLIYLAAKDTARAFKPKNFLIIPFVLILVPTTQLTLTSSVVEEIHIPEFIMEFIQEQTLYNIAFVALGIALMVLAFFLCFSFHFYTLYDQNFKEARKNSLRLLKGHTWFVLSKILVWDLCTALLTIIYTFLDDLFIGSFASTIVSSDMLPTLIILFRLISRNLYACIFIPLAYCVFSRAFNDLLEMQEMPSPGPVTTTDVPSKNLKNAELVIILSTVCCLIFVSGGIYHSGKTAMTELLRGDPGISVLAHRGASDTAPENTLAAFQLAIDEQANWIELDVQQTKDGVLVITHDSNLKRTTGHNVNIWDVTYDEIKDWDNGSHFSVQYNNSRISTLEQALKLCKQNGMRMNIELKPNGHQSEDFTAQALQEINDNDMHDMVGIACLNYWILEQVKKLDPTMPTIYDMVYARGDISQLDKVDIFSIDEAFLSADLVANAHTVDKVVWAWVVNDDSNMLKMYHLGLEGILTDRILVAQQNLAQAQYA